MVINLVNISDLMGTAIIKSRSLKEGILKSEWDKIVGELSKKSFVIFFKQGNLFVGVENSIWIQQMNFQKQSIIEKTNEFLGGNYVNNIIFKIGKKDTKDYFLEKQETEDTIDLDNISLTDDEYLQMEDELKEIKDIFIKKKIKIILEKSYKRKKYLKLHGFKQCKCGIYYSSAEPMCAICMNKEVLKLEETLMKEFKEGKMLKYSQAVRVLESLTEKEYDRIKLKKLSKIKKNIDIYLKNEKNDLAFELSKLYFAIDLGGLENEYIERRAKEFIQLLKK